MYIYRVVLLICRILIGAAVGLTALTIQMKTTSRGKFVAFRRLNPRTDDDVSTEAHTFVNRFPTGWWFGLFFLVVGCIVLDHHATLQFATPAPSSLGRRLLRTSAVVLVEVAIIFGCHEVFFNVAVRPIFNHGLTLKTH